jgi:hypothetical protein
MTTPRLFFIKARAMPTIFAFRPMNAMELIHSAGSRIVTVAGMDEPSDPFRAKSRLIRNPKFETGFPPLGKSAGEFSRKPSDSAFGLRISFGVRISSFGFPV